jgi:hypothetical protein
MPTEIDIDKVCDMILAGDTWEKMAAHFKLPLTTLYDAVHRNPENSARARDARTKSADMIADKAERVLQTAANDPIEMQRARELAQHYRWAAKVRNPKDYGDKIQNDVVVTGLSSRIID